jgi:hypothetical protein
MILESENFTITLWNWDWLCMWDVMTKEKFKEWKSLKFPKIINGEDFLIQVANFALQLAEKNLNTNNLLWIKDN